MASGIAGVLSDRLTLLCDCRPKHPAGLPASHPQTSLLGSTHPVGGLCEVNDLFASLARLLLLLLSTAAVPLLLLVSLASASIPIGCCLLVVLLSILHVLITCSIISIVVQCW